jgi:predicted outer membrane protein
MKSTLSALLLLALACLMPHAQAAERTSEPALRAAFQRAVWPGDIVRSAEAYLRQYPKGPEAARVETARLHAAHAWKLVRSNEVSLYRAAFTHENPQIRRELRDAALGDRGAAVRLAHAQLPAADARSALRYVGWLQFASQLGDERASYELALYFRRTDQPLLAARYEARAVSLGYEPLAALDNTRK